MHRVVVVLQPHEDGAWLPIPQEMLDALEWGEGTNLAIEVVESPGHPPMVVISKASLQI